MKQSGKWKPEFTKILKTGQADGNYGGFLDARICAPLAERGELGRDNQLGEVAGIAGAIRHDRQYRSE